MVLVLGLGDLETGSEPQFPPRAFGTRPRNLSRDFQKEGTEKLLVSDRQEAGQGREGQTGPGAKAWAQGSLKACILPPINCLHLPFSNPTLTPISPQPLPQSYLLHCRLGRL